MNVLGFWQWLHKERFIEKLVERFSTAGDDAELKMVITQALQELIAASAVGRASLSSPVLIKTFESEDVIDSLFATSVQAVCPHRCSFSQALLHLFVALQSCSCSGCAVESQESL